MNPLSSLKICFIITGSTKANLVFPLTNATPQNKQHAIAAIKNIEAGGATVRLKRNVAKESEIALETRSIKTKRIPKSE